MKPSLETNPGLVEEHASEGSSTDHIRIVPLHVSKPKVTIEEAAQTRDLDDGDLFNPGAHQAPSNPKLTYRGGPLLTNVQVYVIFWGKLWGTTPSSSTLMHQLTQFFSTILVSPAIDQMAEYSVPGKTIGHGSVIGNKVITDHAPAQSVTDTAIKTQLRSWIAAGVVPKSTPNTLYFIYLDPGVVSIMGGSRSCQSYCGYHNNIGSTYYAVMPYPTCNGCLAGMSPLDALTGTSSHELCEAITDPVPGSGWYDDTNGEIGDICAWKFKKVGAFNVQLEWSNKQNKCV